MLAKFHQVSLWPGWLFASLLSVLIPLAVGAVLCFRMRKPQPEVAGSVVGSGSGAAQHHTLPPLDRVFSDPPVVPAVSDSVV